MPEVTDPALLQQLNGQSPTPPKGPVYGAPPKAPDPYQVQKDQISQANEQTRLGISLEDQQMQREKFALEKQKLAMDQEKFGAEQGKAANFALRARDSLAAYDKAGLDPDSMIGQWGNQNFPNITAQMSDDKRNAVRGAEREFIAAILRYDSGAAIPPAEFESAYLTYFPSSGAGPEEIAQKKRARETALQGLMMGAGPAVGKMPAAANQQQGQQGGVPAADIRFQDDRRPDPTGGYRMSPENERAYLAFIESQKGNPNFSIDMANRFLSSIGEQPVEDNGFVEATRRGDVRTTAVDTSGADKAYQQQLEDEARRRASEPGARTPGLTDLVTQGASFGLSDEIMGAGEAIARGLTGDGRGYSFERDLYRRQLEQARDRAGGFGTAAEIGGSLLTANPNALLSAPLTLGQTVRQGAALGAGTGAAAGFGYGEGAEGSMTNALLGGAIGAPLGGAISAAGPAFSAMRGRLPQRTPADLGVTNASGAPATGADIAAAGQAEGVTVSRAMVDPASRNRVAGVERTVAGGPRIQEGLNTTRREIEQGVQRLGQGGTAQTDAGAGQTIADVAERYIGKSGKFFDSRYNALRQAAGGIKVPPTNSVKAIDDIIAGLSETPQMNSAEIAYLQKIKSDFSKDLSIDALRKARTKLRKDIAKGELTFGDSEANVLAVMDAASSDITAGLTAAGKGNIATRFAETDKLYRDRMEFIGGTIQKLIGRRNANLPPDQIIKNFRALPKKDVAGLARLMKEMEPEEQANIAATFAESLGKNNNSEFLVSDFIKHAEDIPEAARRSLFGDAGEQSLKNLVLLSKAHKAVPRGGSPTGAVQDYRGWLVEKLIGAGVGGGLGGYAGGDLQSAAAGAAAGGALASISTARNILSARALMSPKITQWIRQAPNTTNPAAIDAHFKKLGAIAAQEPALAGDIQAIQQRLMEAAKQSPARAAASEQEADAGPKPPQQ